MPADLLQTHIDRGATTLPYADPTDHRRFVEVVDTFGQLELEYAAIRKSCVLVDCPHRAAVRVSGSDATEFLNRMLTQELADLPDLSHRRSFWLNRKGRIDADLRVTRAGDQLRLVLDVHAVARTIETIGEFVFAEDIEFQDLRTTHRVLSLHGPSAAAVVAEVAGDGSPAGSLRNGAAASFGFGGADVLVEREDQTGEIGLHLTCPAAAAPALHETLLDAGGWRDAAPGEPGPASRVRPAGWHAFNIARIEAGVPLFNIDFGASNLPHESGVLDSRVSFTKGCYLGQEVVARMQSLGHPKQRLVGLRFADQRPDLPQPVTGAQVFVEGDAKPVGQVTSSSISPMLGAAPVCFAMVRYAQSEPGTAVVVEAEGERIAAEVQDGLSFWRRG